MSTAHHGRAVLAVIAASFLFSTGGAARAFAGFIGTANQVACWRVVAGGTIMLAISALRGQSRAIASLWASPVVWFMAASSVLYQVAFFTGAERIGVGAGTLIAQAVAPLVAGLLSWAIGSGRPTLAWLLCTIAAIGGMALITGGGGTFDTFSLAMVVASGALYSINVVAGAHLVATRGRGGSHRSAATPVTGMQVLTAAFGLGAVMALPVALRGMDWVATPAGLGTSAWTGAMSTAVGYLLFGYGITHLPAPTVSTLAVSEPVWAALLGVFLLDETVTVRGWLGCAVIVASLALMSWSQARATRTEPSFNL